MFTLSYCSLGAWLASSRLAVRLLEKEQKLFLLLLSAPLTSPRGDSWHVTIVSAGDARHAKTPKETPPPTDTARFLTGGSQFMGQSRAKDDDDDDDDADDDDDEGDFGLHMNILPRLDGEGEFVI